MPKRPTTSGKDFIRSLQNQGFNIIRISGSHYRLKHRDGRITTIPVHGNKDLPKGLLRKIISIDLDTDLEVFIELWESR